MLTLVATPSNSLPVAIARGATELGEGLPAAEKHCLWIALDQALGGVDDWREQYTRCALVERESVRALVVEAYGDSTVRTSYRTLNSEADLDDVAVWSFMLDDTGISNVFMGEAPASAASVEALADLFWVFHRLAVEDRASILRS